MMNDGSGLVGEISTVKKGWRGKPGPLVIKVNRPC